MVLLSFLFQPAPPNVRRGSRFYEIKKFFPDGAGCSALPGEAKTRPFYSKSPGLPVFRFLPIGFNFSLCMDPGYFNLLPLEFPPMP